MIVDDSLSFTVKVFGSYLVDDHPLYLKYRHTMCNVTLSNFNAFLLGTHTKAFFWPGAQAL